MRQCKCTCVIVIGCNFMGNRPQPAATLNHFNTASLPFSKALNRSLKLSLASTPASCRARRARAGDTQPTSFLAVNPPQPSEVSCPTQLTTAADRASLWYAQPRPLWHLAAPHLATPRTGFSLAFHAGIGGKKKKTAIDKTDNNNQEPSENSSVSVAPHGTCMGESKTKKPNS